MNAAKTGIIAEFKTGYLQRAIRLNCTVAGGTDTGLRDSSKLGYAPGRLVKIAAENSSGVRALTAPTGVTATSLGDATHILAQSDDTIRDLPEDYNYPERYSTLMNGICKNDTEAKTVAVYKIVDKEDVKLISLD